MSLVFGDFDVSTFWKQSDYANKTYVEKPVTLELLESVQQELGYQLPASYVELMRFQNGGIPLLANHRTAEPTSWATDHVAISGIYGIGRSRHYSLCGDMGSAFMMAEWGYPAIGVYFADCPSGGHDMLCLDYRECGPEGEPQVVHVAQEFNYKVTFVAKTFEDFIRGLESDEAFESDLIERDESQAVSVWINPAFAKKMGMEVPEDGWVKRDPNDTTGSD